MDWLSLLLIALVVISVIRKVYQGMQTMPAPRGGGARPLPGGDPEPLPLEAAPSSWSSGWGDWPGALPELVDEAEAEEASWEAVTETTAGVPILVPELPVEVPVRLEAETVALPVISLEPLEVDREAEHHRLHQRLRAAPPAPPLRPRRASAPRLRSRAELRRAVVLAEMLGPPRALQPLDVPTEAAR